LLRVKVWVVPSPSVSRTVVGQVWPGGWNCRGVPSRITLAADSDQPKPIDEAEVSSEL
jgi:hypothetical protein